MISSTKLYVLLTGSAAAATLGAGPALHSEPTLTALFVGGALTAVTGIVRLVRSAPIGH